MSDELFWQQPLLMLLGCSPATRGLCPGCDRPMTPRRNGAWEQLPLLGALTRLGCSQPCSHFPSHAVERRQRGVGRRTLLLWLQLVPCSPVCWASSEVGREASVAGEPGLELLLPLWPGVQRARLETTRLSVFVQSFG